MFVAKSFKIGNKAFCITQVNGDTYLNGMKVESPRALKNILISNAENLQDATMVADVLSIYPSGRPSNLLYSH